MSCLDLPFLSFLPSSSSCPSALLLFLRPAGKQVLSSLPFPTGASERELLIKIQVWEEGEGVVRERKGSEEEEEEEEEDGGKRKRGRERRDGNFKLRKTCGGGERLRRGGREVGRVSFLPRRPPPLSFFPPCFSRFSSLRAPRETFLLPPPFYLSNYLKVFELRFYIWVVVYH